MADKTWQKIIVRAPLATSESIGSFITDLTGSGVEIGDDKNSAEYCLVIGYLASDDPELPDKLAAIRAYLADIFKQLPQSPEASLKLESIADQDWHQKWKESFKPFRLSEKLIIKPSWEDYSPAQGEMVIEIDPGMAFGTGLHASTRLATGLLESYLSKTPAPPETVLDVGTGTGILAIGAALLGCRRITAIDNDPEAITAAIDNVRANGFAEIIDASTTDLGKLSGPYDLILANIIHNTLVEMAPTLATLLAPGGVLILAGILAGSQAENITRIYNDNGLPLLETRSSGEWSTLSFRKQ